MELHLGISKLISFYQILLGFGHLFYTTTFFIKGLATWCQCLFYRLQNSLVCFGSLLATSQARELKRAIAGCSLAPSTTGTVWSYTSKISKTKNEKGSIQTPSGLIS